MTDKKLTDEEIIKALECCSTPCCKCDECPLYCVGVNCSSFELHRYALDLINRQKTENDKLNGELISALSELSLTRASLNNAKAEAYKEFAERLKEEMRLEDDCDYNCQECCYECNDYVIAIDNLLKEMVGEEE